MSFQGQFSFLTLNSVVPRFFKLSSVDWICSVCFVVLGCLKIVLNLAEFSVNLEI